jgi:single-strand DNA-binding protein
MARSLNDVTLLGNVGADPEVKATAGGKKRATISLATSQQWKNQAGEKQEKTQWHRCIAWGNVADIVGQYVKKGDKLLVKGSIEYRSYEKDGTTIYVTEIKRAGARAARLAAGPAPSGEPDPFHRAPILRRAAAGPG